MALGIDNGTLALCIPLAGIATGALSVYLHHVRKLAEIRSRAGMVETSIGSGRAASTEVRAELEALREEVSRLRDTSTRFDLSFDAGLNQLEERVSRVEGNTADSVGRSAASQADRAEPLMARSR